MFAFGILLVGVGLTILSIVIFLAPRRALHGLGRFGSTPQIHFGELSLRALIGVVFLAGAPATRHPAAVAVIGGFLIVTALILMILPRRWHAAYSTWWAQRITAAQVRLLAPVSLAAGAVLVWVAA